MRRLILTIWIVATALASASFGQSSPVAEKIDEYSVTTNEALRATLDVALQDILRRKAKDRLHLIFWGTPSQIETEKRRASYYIKIGRYDPTLVEFRIAGSISPRKTEIWTVPEGAAAPEIKPEAWIYREVGRVYKGRATFEIDDYLQEVKRLDDHQAYVINYGSPEQIELREQWLRDALRRAFNYHWPRITFVNGGPGPVRTVMWLAPPGAKHPMP